MCLRCSPNHQPSVLQAPLAGPHPHPHVVRPLADTLADTLRQAAAAARIIGRPDIFAAAESGDVALVEDHATADAASVGFRDAECDAALLMFVL